MYKSCKTAYSAQRQQLFQRVLFTMLQTQDYQSVTISALCREAGIPRNAFYRYFDNMDDVLYAQMDALILDASLYLWDKTDVCGYLLFWKEHKVFLDTLEKNDLISVLLIRALELLADHYKGEELSVQNIRALCYLNSLMMIMISWHHGGMVQSIEEIKDTFWQVFQRE